MVLFISPPFGNIFSPIIRFINKFIVQTNITCIVGTYTVKPRPGKLQRFLQTFRYSWKHNGWANKIGLRNQGIKNVRFNDDTVASIYVHDESDVEIMNKYIPSDASIEINLSCPNVVNYIPSNLEILLNVQRRWCIIKLSPITLAEDIELLQTKGFRQFHCTNTLPVENIGGLSGPTLKPYVIKYLNLTRDYITIAGGGIQNMNDIMEYKSHGAMHFSIASVCMNPVKLCILLFFWCKNQFKNHALK